MEEGKIKFLDEIFKELLREGQVGKAAVVAEVFSDEELLEEIKKEVKEEKVEALKKKAEAEINRLKAAYEKAVAAVNLRLQEEIEAINEAFINRGTTKKEGIRKLPSKIDNGSNGGGQVKKGPESMGRGELLALCRKNNDPKLWNVYSKRFGAKAKKRHLFEQR